MHNAVAFAVVLLLALPCAVLGARWLARRRGPRLSEKANSAGSAGSLGGGQRQDPRLTVREQLESIASQVLPGFAMMKDWAELLDHRSLYQPELYRLARQVREIDTDAEVLLTFFTEPAVELLMSLPNRFWFWTIVRAAVRKVPAGEEMIGLVAVLSAFAEQRRAIAFRFNFVDIDGHLPHGKLEELTAAEACACVAVGIIVMRSGGGRGRPDVPELNPIFAEPQPQ